MTSTSHVAWVTCVFVVLTWTGCSPVEQTGSPSGSSEHEVQTLAKVGERSITEREFEAYLKTKKISVRGEKHLDTLLQEYAEREALAQAIEAGGALDKAQMDAELNEFRKEMLISRYFDQHLRTSVTRGDVEQHYTDHAREYETKRVRVAHVLVKVPKSSTDAERATQLAKINEAHKRLKDGRPFEAVAKELSEDRVSANRGGDMGWIREGAVAPQFSKAAFSLAEGSFSEPIETGFGYHILKVLKAPSSQRRSLESVEGDIRYKLKGLAKTTESERLKKSIPVQIKRDGWMPSVTTTQREEAKP